MEWLNGTGRTLRANVATIKSFALHIIEQRRKQLAAEAAAAAGKDQGPIQSASDSDSDVASNGAASAGGMSDAEEGARDLLSLFMAAKGPDGKPLSTQQLIDTVINFIIAGRDTTAQVGVGCTLEVCGAQMFFACVVYMHKGP